LEKLQILSGKEKEKALVATFYSFQGSPLHNKYIVSTIYPKSVAKIS
jgi:hypothetical protein